MLTLIGYDKPLLIPFSGDVSGIHDDTSNQNSQYWNERSNVHSLILRLTKFPKPSHSRTSSRNRLYILSALFVQTSGPETSLFFFCVWSWTGVRTSVPWYVCPKYGITHLEPCCSRKITNDEVGVTKRSGDTTMSLIISTHLKYNTPYFLSMYSYYMERLCNA